MLSQRLLRIELLIALVAIAARFTPGPRTVDDAYITFRYSQNLLNGDGLVYNPGERVLGTTTPVYALMMAGAGLLQGGSQANFPLLALVLNTMADAGTCLLLVAIGSRLGSRTAGIAASLVWAVAPWSVTFAIGGLETSFLVVLATATFYLHLSDRPAGAALAGAIALLTRPDALLFVAPMAAARLWQIRSGSPVRLREAIAFLAPLLIWLAASLEYYQSPIPHSIFAKAAAYRVPADAGLVRLLQHYSTPFLGHESLGLWWIAVGLILYPALYLLGALRSLRVDRSTWPILVYPWLYFMAYAVANPLLFRWYLTPPLPAYLLGIFLGIDRLSEDLGRRGLAAGAISLAVLSTLSAWTIKPDHGPDRPAPRMAFIELELLYQQAAQEMRPRIGEDQVLAAADIGALGFFTGARVLDLLGLVSPEATAYYPAPESIYAINYAVPAELVLDAKPDHLVALEVYLRLGVLTNQEFLASYEIVETLPTDIYGSDGMLLYSLRDLP